MMVIKQSEEGLMVQGTGHHSYADAAAARFVKEKATICADSTPSSPSDVTRREMASVFPTPAQAMNCRWPPR